MRVFIAFIAFIVRVSPDTGELGELSVLSVVHSNQKHEVRKRTPPNPERYNLVPWRRLKLAAISGGVPWWCLYLLKYLLSSVCVSSLRLIARGNPVYDPWKVLDCRLTVDLQQKLAVVRAVDSHPAETHQPFQPATYTTNALPATYIPLLPLTPTPPDSSRSCPAFPVPPPIPRPPA